MHISLSFQPISPLPAVASIRETRRETSRSRCLSIAILVLFFCTVLALRRASAQIYYVQEMNTAQIQNFDRLRTAVILVGGILEEHGPYLPSYTDGYVNEFIAHEVANAITARPGWKVLMFPSIPLGASGANGIGGKLHFPGTYDVRFQMVLASGLPSILSNR
jgi:Creatinine amidohydrolase